MSVMRVRVSFSMFVSNILGFVMAVPLSLLAGFLASPILYEYQMARVDIGPGSVGTEALLDTPAAASIADMEQMEYFTIEVKRDFMSASSHRALKWNDKTYYTIDLPSGERVAALINFKAATKMAYTDSRPLAPDTLLPIGQWVEWKHPSSDEKSYQNYYDGLYMDFSHYVDMSGDPGSLPTKSHAFGQVMIVVFLILYIFFWWLSYRIGVKKGLLKPDPPLFKGR
ncbi:hypothetical protein AALA99_02575 [Anaerotruncus colihominis]|uniref:hypothetical protein n=1 Tax=Anaerotruncus colihominis TaxID=169435 RepID=UPI0035163065